MFGFDRMDQVTQAGRVELVNLYHLAPTALSGQDHVPTAHERMCWAAGQFAAEHAERGISSARAYKALCSALGR